MLLPSRLTHSTLGDILGALHRAKISGVLELRELTAQGRQHQVYLNNGMITRIVSEAQVPALGKLLGIKDAPARRSSEAAAQKYGSYVLELGLRDESSIREGLTKQTRLLLEALFELKDAALRFHVAIDTRETGVKRAPLSIDDFLTGRPRARRDRDKAAHRPRFETSQAAAPDQSSRRRPVASRKTSALAVLGLVPGATRDEINQAFRSLALDTHPDLQGNGQTETAFAQLTEAYHFLTG